MHHSYHHPISNISSTRHHQIGASSQSPTKETDRTNFNTEKSSHSKPSVFKRTNKIDWTVRKMLFFSFVMLYHIFIYFLFFKQENSKQGTHFWAEQNNPQSSCSCYLSEQDALELHKLESSVKCFASSKNEIKYKCIICKIVVHDSCIDLLQVILR